MRKLGLVPPFHIRYQECYQFYTTDLQHPLVPRSRCCAISMHPNKPSKVVIREPTKFPYRCVDLDDTGTSSNDDNIEHLRSSLGCPGLLSRVGPIGILAKDRWPSGSSIYGMQ